jgi:hypothetical protein
MAGQPINQCLETYTGASAVVAADNSDADVVLYTTNVKSTTETTLGATGAGGASNVEPTGQAKSSGDAVTGAVSTEVKLGTTGYGKPINVG